MRVLEGYTSQAAVEKEEQKQAYARSADKICVQKSRVHSVCCVIEQCRNSSAGYGRFYEIIQWSSVEGHAAEKKCPWSFVKEKERWEIDWMDVESGLWEELARVIYLIYDS